MEQWDGLILQPVRPNQGDEAADRLLGWQRFFTRSDTLLRGGFLLTIVENACETKTGTALITTLALAACVEFS